MLTSSPPDEVAPTPESTTGILFRKMEAALDQNDVMQFSRLAQERHALMFRCRDAQGRPALSASHLSDLLCENRHWNRKLGEHCARLRAEVNRCLSEKNTCLALARAYAPSLPHSHCVTRRG